MIARKDAFSVFAKIRFVRMEDSTKYFAYKSHDCLEAYFHATIKIKKRFMK